MEVIGNTRGIGGTEGLGVIHEGLGVMNGVVRECRVYRECRVRMLGCVGWAGPTATTTSGSQRINAERLKQNKKTQRTRGKFEAER